MSSPDDSFPVPAPPDLPSFTIGDSAAEPAEPAVKRAADPAERHIGTGLVRHAVVFEDDRIDPDAAKVVRRLERAGYQAYLVGGCVRDLLLGGKPKDFDVATSARPEDCRSLFRNCRIIGRRFRLAHILFGAGKVIEVATFRRDPTLAADDWDGGGAALDAADVPHDDGRAPPVAQRVRPVKPRDDSSDLLIRHDNV